MQRGDYIRWHWAQVLFDIVKSFRSYMSGVDRFGAPWGHLSIYMRKQQQQKELLVFREPNPPEKQFPEHQHSIAEPKSSRRSMQCVRKSVKVVIVI